MKTYDRYHTSFKDWLYIFFHQKTCPHCGGKLTPAEETVGGNLQGERVRQGISAPYYDRVMEQERSYQCAACHHQFSIPELRK